MRMRKVIMSFFAVTVILTHLIVSGGLMTVIHSCTLHQTRNVTTFSLINPSNEEESCCGTEEHKSSDSHIATGCCDYNISAIHLSSFVTASFYHDQDFQAISDIFTKDQVTAKPFFQIPGSISYFNKHGGRFIVNMNHQIIT